MEGEQVDLSPMADYIGDILVIILEDEIVSVGTIKDYRKRENGVGECTYVVGYEKANWWVTSD
jgi:hypothetical protein